MKPIYILVSIIFSFFGMVLNAQTLNLSITECRQLALANSEDVKIAGNTVAQAELDRKIANTAMLPKFDGNATGVYLLPNMDMSIAELQTRGTYMAGINVIQPLYSGGKITAGRNLARIGKDVAEINLRKARIDVISDADNAYWTYLSVLNKVKLLESYCLMMDTIYHQTNVAVLSGMTTENNLLRIEARRSDITYQLQKARNGAELCRLSLCRIIGADFETVPILTDTIFINQSPGTLETDISAIPELRLLQENIKAKEQDVKMARSDFLPTVGLSLGYTYFGNMKLKGAMQDADGSYVPYSYSMRDGYGLAMLSVSIPLFHWGEGVKKVKRAKLELENCRFELDKYTRLLSIQANQAAKNYEDGYRMIGSARLALSLAEENLRIMRNRYNASMSPLTDLLDAQTQWQQASSDYIESQAQYKIYETEYLRSIGQLE